MKRPFGRRLSDFGTLSVVEVRLLEDVARGNLTVASPSCPTEKTDSNRVRSEFLRYLLLGGDSDHPVHERGVMLRGAWIEGSLDLNDAETLVPLKCEVSNFDNDLLLRDATFAGSLALRGSKVPGVSADGAVIKGSVFLDEGFLATGEVRLLGAAISGSLQCGGGKFEPKEGNALSADRAVIKGSVFLNENFRATGPVRLLGAEIGGSLTCGVGKFVAKEGPALHADRAVIKGTVFLNKGFLATGLVRLLGAEIGGDLNCIAGNFEPTEGDALSADRAVIKGSVFLYGDFHATGPVRLLGAAISGSLECGGGKFEPKEGYALLADRAVIKGSLLLNKGFLATGLVRLLGVEIGGDLNCSAGNFESHKGASLTAQDAQIGGALYIQSMSPPLRKASFANARIGQLCDAPTSWGEDIILDGLIYGGFAGSAPTSAQERLAWLDRQPAAHSGKRGDGTEFRPQPWRQLQNVLREMGHTEAAREVAIAFENRLRHADLIGQGAEYWSSTRKKTYRFICRAFHDAFRVLTGYGYRPLRLLVWMTGVWFACGVFYWWAALPPNNIFAPTNPLVFQHPDYASCAESSSTSQKPTNWYLCGPLPEEYTGFSPLAYSLDLLLPLVDLQQAHDWGPKIPTPKTTWWEEAGTSLVSLKHWTRRVVWFEITFGWLASLLLVAIVSGLTKRRED